MTKDALRVRNGQSLTDMNNQAIGAIAQLQGIKTNLIAMKASVTADTVNFTAEDVAEINTIIAGLATKIQAILS